MLSSAIAAEPKALVSDSGPDIRFCAPQDGGGKERAIEHVRETMFST